MCILLCVRVSVLLYNNQACEVRCVSVWEGGGGGGCLGRLKVKM